MLEKSILRFMSIYMCSIFTCAIIYVKHNPINVKEINLDLCEFIYLE